MPYKNAETATLILKKVPIELKNFWDGRARMNDRSMNKEIIRLLEQEKARLLGGETSGKDKSQIDSIVRRMHSLPTLDNRLMNEILYDEDGMPKPAMSILG